jgi:2-oxoglutarate ferredoxin oxidoreductase subunit gamma
MVSERILCAGFGGQGVMVLGKLIACAAMLDGREVTWMPSYGPEMRGGTAYCSVVVSDHPVGSPIVTNNATSLMAMNMPSLDRFEQSVLPGGLILFNSSLIDRQVSRNDVLVQRLEANKIAAQCGAPKAANMVMLGAYMAIREVIDRHHLTMAFRQIFGTMTRTSLELNMKAVHRGFESVDAGLVIPKAA